MNVKELYKYLPFRIRIIAEKLPASLTDTVTEIRLRVGSPVSLTAGNKNVTFDDEGRIRKPPEGVRITSYEMDECISYMTKSSLYSYGDSIKRGYIMLDGGARAGISGCAFSENGTVKRFERITSVCLRVSRFIPYAAECLAEFYEKNGLHGTLVYSPPGMGKTTFLRSAAYLLSRGKKPYRVGIADERGELYVSEMDGGLTDVISGCPKNRGIDILTRTMNPEIIVCDEISEEEAHGIIESANGGVTLIASCHGESADGIRKKRFIGDMTERGIFTAAVKLMKNESYESVIEWL